MKTAVLIGINYIGTPNELKGCINDVKQIKNMLESHYNYTNIVMLTDDTQLPTKENILRELRNLINNSSKYSEIWIHYSGHGSSIRDTNSDELDRRDEILVPIDFALNGFIVDDELNSIFSKTKTTTKIIMDCCNSGSNVDLFNSVYYINNKFAFAKERRNNINNTNNILSLSGCMDNQTSAESQDKTTKNIMGALTSTVISVIRDNNYNITCGNLLSQVTIRLKNNKQSQIPILSCNNTINVNNMFLTTIPPSPPLPLRPVTKPRRRNNNPNGIRLSRRF
jgi:hypothetical protein